MKRWLALALLALLGLPALAADNATLITPCGTGCVTVRAKDIGAGVQSPVYILGDTSGNPIYGTAGTANANVLTVQGIAAMTALKVDGSGVTQPVSGTVTVTQGTAANLNATVTGTVAATQSGTWTVQQGTPPWTIQGDSASGASNAGNPVKGGGVFNTTQPTVTTGQTVDGQYTARGAAIVATGVDAFTVGGTVTANAGSGTFAVSGTVTANQGTSPWTDNITQFGGTNVSTGTGASGAGIPRVTVANDSNILATQSGTWTVQQGTPPWADNVTQFGGTNLSTGAGAGGAGIPRVTISNDSSLAANQSVNVAQFSGTAATAKASGTNAATTDTALVVAPSPNPSDVCPSLKPISQTASTDLITSTNKLHICAILIVSATAQSVSLVEGTGSVCATGQAALIGAITTPSLALAANGGFSHTAERAFMVTQTTADHLCLLQSGAGNVSGFISYVDHN